MDATTVQIPSDEGGFSRRECPRCHAHFKVRAPDEDQRLVALALALRVPHLNASETSAAPETRHCPYCGARAPADGWWTGEQRRYLDERAESLAAQVRWQQLRPPGSANPTDGSLASSVPPPDPLPLRPDAVDDLVAVHVPCCGTVQKLTDAWKGPVRCHFCGAVHSRAASRDFGLEMALLREWTESP